MSSARWHQKNGSLGGSRAEPQLAKERNGQCIGHLARWHGGERNGKERAPLASGSSELSARCVHRRAVRKRQERDCALWDCNLLRDQLRRLERRIELAEEEASATAHIRGLAPPPPPPEGPRPSSPRIVIVACQCPSCSPIRAEYDQGLRYPLAVVGTQTNWSALARPKAPPQLLCLLQRTTGQSSEESSSMPSPRSASS